MVRTTYSLVIRRRSHRMFHCQDKMLDKILCQLRRSPAPNCSRWKMTCSGIVHEQMRTVRVITLCFRGKYDENFEEKTEIIFCRNPYFVGTLQNPLYSSNIDKCKYSFCYFYFSRLNHNNIAIIAGVNKQ